jgi:sugar phosphate isomerase/epimerase
MSTSPLLRYGYSSLGCPELDFASVSALATRFGLRELELRTLEKRVDLPKYFAETDPGLVRTRELLENAGQRICGLGTSVRLLNGLDGLPELREFAALAQTLNVPWLRIFDGGKPTQPPATDADFEPAIALLNAWEAERAQNGWACGLAIETHDAFVTSPPVLELAKRFDGTLNILWDAHHTWRQGGEPVAETWAVLRPYVRHIHVKDSASKPEDITRPYAYVLPGAGGFPFTDLEALLVRDHYHGVVSLEWEKFWHPTLPPLEDALAAWLA